MCKKIHRGGNAEQYHADKKYKEAVAVAVEACADDTKGQTCFICTQALHWKTKEGLVRGCACRGTAGFAHVSCLAEQAKILNDEADENNLGDNAVNERWTRWHSCSLCEQKYHGVVSHALGWACWKTYVGRPETDWTRDNAMNLLGNGLSEAYHYAEALSIWEAELSTLQRLGVNERDIRMMSTLLNKAQCYAHLGQIEKSFAIEQRVYRMQREIYGDDHEGLRITAMNIARTLAEGLDRQAAAAKFLREAIPRLTRKISKDHADSMKMQLYLANSLCCGDDAARGGVREAVTILEDLNPRARRVLGPQHPEAQAVQNSLDYARRKLAAFDARA